MEQLRVMAIQSYRNLLRVQRQVFGADWNTLYRAREHARKEFTANKNISDSAVLQSKIDEANAIADFLRKNIVQGVVEGSQNTIRVKLDERLEMHDYSKNGRPTCGCC